MPRVAQQSPPSLLVGGTGGTRKPQHDAEELRNLMTGASQAFSNSTGGGGGGGRWLRIAVTLVVAFCLVLFTYESLEVDQKTGDVQLKLYTGNKQQQQQQSPTPPVWTGDNDAAVSSDSTDKSSDVGSKAKSSDTEKDAVDSVSVPVTEAPKTTTETPTQSTPLPTGTPISPLPTQGPTRPETEAPTEPVPTAAAATMQVDAQCQATCATASSSTVKLDGQQDDLTVSNNMLVRLKQQKEIWIRNVLTPAYGAEYVPKLFPPDAGTKAFRDPTKLKDTNPPEGEQQQDQGEGEGWDRMVRKFKLKLYQVQLGMVLSQVDSKQQCLGSCLESMTPGTYSKLVFQNGGHSASAGHGDFYRESYTAILGDDLNPLLQQIGLDFQVRNYAMGGMSSGEELALCTNSVFGKDVDLFNWDYGMTDGRDYYRMYAYAVRGARRALLSDSLSQPGNVRHRPALFAIHIGGGQIEVLQHLQDLGMTTLGMSDYFEKKVAFENLPDMLGKTDAEIAALPKYLQYFKCEGKIESGDPGCGDNKFNKTFCEKRQAMVSWHPGWKHHALNGHQLAYTILEATQQALESMTQDEPTGETLEQKQTRLQQKIQQLNDEEQRDYERLFNTPTPERAVQWFDTLWSDHPEAKDKFAAFDVDSFLKDPNFCHTAILPAEIRYKGILTENFKEVGGVFDQVYEHGVMLTKVMAEEKDNTKAFVADGKDALQMTLVSEDREWEVCEDLIHIDHKDFFYVSTTEAWRSITIPNEASKQYYTEFDAAKSKGLIYACPKKCKVFYVMLHP